MAFRIRQPVRHPDVDRAGIVYYPRFYDFFHRALEDFFLEEVKISYWDLAEDLHVALPVVHIETDFVRPLAHGDVLTVEIETLSIGVHSVTLGYKVFRPGEPAPAASSKVVLCTIGLPGWTKTAIPEPVRRAFERHLVAR